jgi:carbon storage regulator
MLVLTRKLNQAVHIGDNIVITVTKIRGEAVRLGIQAPTDVKVMRSELLETAAKKQAPLKLARPDSDAEVLPREISFELSDDSLGLESELEDEPLLVGTTVQTSAGFA